MDKRIIKIIAGFIAVALIFGISNSIIGKRAAIKRARTFNYYYSSDVVNEDRGAYISEFFSNIASNDIEKSYNLLTDEAKVNFPTIEKFKEFLDTKLFNKEISARYIKNIAYVKSIETQEYTEVTYNITFNVPNGANLDYTDKNIVEYMRYNTLVVKLIEYGPRDTKIYLEEKEPLKAAQNPV